MKKILVIITSPFDTYGIGAVVRNYTDVLKHKFQFDYLLCSGADEVGEVYIKSNNIRIIDLNCARLRTPIKYMYALIDYLKNNQYDAIHAHGNSGTLFLEIHAAKVAGVRIRIAHCHNTSCKYKFLHYLLKPLLNIEMTMSLSCSKLANKWLFYKDGVILNNAISTKKYIYDDTVRETIRRNYNLDGSYVILNVGRLSKQKNQNFIINLMPDILKIRPNAKLIVVGDGEKAKEFECIIEELNLEDSVYLIGKKNNVDEFYQAADCFVFPSVFEGLGLALIEAQAAGLYCIASTNVPLDANAGKLVKYLPLDRELWKSAILNNDNYGNRYENSLYAINNIKLAGYDIDTNAFQLEKIYNT